MLSLKFKKIASMLSAATAIVGITAPTMLSATTAYADSNNSPSFTVQSVLPKENNKSSSFFDFKVTPNETKDLSIKISNTSKKADKFDVTPNNAITNENGIIDYTQHVKKDKLLKLGFTDVLTTTKTKVVSVPGKSTATVHFKMKMPDSKFNGILLGGFVIAPHDAVNKAMKANESAKEKKSIVSTYQYVVGARLYQNKDTVNPNIKFTGVNYGLKHSVPAIQVGIKNAAPTMVGFKDAKIKVTNSKNKVVFSKTSQGLNFAPNDGFKYFISLNNKQLTTGKYKLSMILTSKQGTKYKYNKEFTVTNDKANDVKKNAADFSTTKTKNNYTMAIIIGVIATGVIIGLIAYIIASKRKNKDNK